MYWFHFLWGVAVPLVAGVALPPLWRYCEVYLIFSA